MLSLQPQFNLFLNNSLRVIPQNFAFEFNAKSFAIVIPVFLFFFLLVQFSGRTAQSCYLGHVFQMTRPMHGNQNSQH